MKNDNFGTLIWIALLLLLIFGGQIGGNAPFVTDKPSLLIVEETEQRTTAVEAVMFAMEQAADQGAVRHRRLDSQQTDLSLEEKWVQDARATWEKAGKAAPWAVGANSRTGFSQALPASKEAAVQLVRPLGGK